MAAPLAAAWFDGRSSRARAVMLRLEPGPRGPALHVDAADGTAASLVLAHREVGWPEAWSARRAPPRLVVDLGPHGSLEVADVAGWQAALREAGHVAPLAQRMQTRWPVFLGVLLLAAAALAAFYRWGTPWAATQLTRQVPLAWETALSARALDDLDRRWLKPSKLPAARQHELRARFEVLARDVPVALRRYRDYAPPLSLRFRAAREPNAFALPGGVIVMTDAMVEAAARENLPDEALVGVLAHEIGHVVHRHTTRMVVEQGVLNVGLGLALGDVSTVFSVGASALTGLSYRRNHEAEADCFALGLLRRTGMTTAPMADLLLKIDPAAKVAGEPGWLSILSSHPATHERAIALKTGSTSCLS
jgi:Zn-dependent protease with chaperone function